MTPLMHLSLFISRLRSLPGLAAVLALLLSATTIPTVQAQIGGVSAPAFPEDTQGNVTFEVAAWGIYRHVSVQNLSPGLYQRVTVEKTGERYVFPSVRASFLVRITPVPNANGTGTIRLHASDGAAINHSTDVNVQIVPINDISTFAFLPASATISEDSPYSVIFHITDPENIRGAVISARSSDTSVVPQTAGNLSVTRLSNDTVTQDFRLDVLPAANAVGTTVITISATEGGLTASTTLKLTVTPFDDPPTVALRTVTTTEDTPRTESFDLFDPDTPYSGITFRPIRSSTPSLLPVENIAVSGTDRTRTVTFRPQPNQNGSSIVTFEVFQTTTPTKRSEVALTFNATPVNDPPVAGPSVALNLPGGNAGAKAFDVGLTDPAGPHTIEAWIRPTEITGARQWLLNVGQAGPGAHHWLLTRSTPGRVSLQAGAWNFGSINVPLPTDTWTHVAAVYDGSLYEVFLNGIRAASLPLSTFALAPSGQPIPLNLGNRLIGNEANFRGQIDELHVWNRALTPPEIANRFRAPLVGTEAGLVLYYRFDENQGLLLYDSASTSGSANATVQDGAEWITPLRRDFYNNILSGLPGLLSDPRYPNSPTSVSYLSSAFEAPSNVAEFYGQRVSGWIVAPVTGNYTFYIASDDQSELLLSTDESPANKTRIARVDSWTLSQQWTTEPAQRSAPVSLVAGRRYYIEANMIEFGGGDNLAVRWDLPGGTTEAPIPAYRFDAATHFGTWPVAEDDPTPIYLTGVDFEAIQAEPGTTLNFIIVDAPKHGRLTPSAGGGFLNPLQNPITYTPDSNYNGPDSFTFVLEDQGGLRSAPARVQLDVFGANDLPDISPISDLTVLEGDTSGPIAYTVNDADGPPESVIVTATTSDPNLIPLENILLTGTGNHRTVEVRPAPGEIGTVTITLTAFDGDRDGRTKQEVFKVRVDPRPAYALVDLGELNQRNQSFGRSVNDATWAAAFAQSQDGDARAALFRGLTGNSGLEELTPGGSVIFSQALGINAANMVVGTLRPSSTSPAEAFSWRNDLLTSLRSALSPGVDSIANAVNGNGDIVGSLRIGASQRHIFLLPAVGTLTNLPSLGGSNAGGEAINNRGTLAGWATDAAGKPHALRFSLADGRSLIPELPGHDSSHAYGINDDDLVVGDSFLASDPQASVRAFLREGSQTIDLGTLPGGTNTVAYAINNFRQIVGEANDSLGRRRAFFRTAERNFDLNQLIHDSRNLVFESGLWTLEEARAISRNGTIAATGRVRGRNHAFLAIPAWVIGRQIARPEGAVARRPEIELIDGGVDDNPDNAFIWSDRENKLYAIRPVTARLKWFKSFRDILGSGTNITVNTDRIEVVGVSVWPKDPQIHVAKAPVEVEPPSPAFRYAFQNVLFFTQDTPTVDPTSKTFNKNDRGYSVLYYLETGNTQPKTPNPTTQRPFFDVVRTYRFTDLLVSSNALVGQRITDPNHRDYNHKNGFVFHEVSPYDGAGTERAYDRPSRTGPIIPVNLDTAADNDNLVVVWYQTNRIGVAWASRPIHYTLAWPPDSQVGRIVIASTKGSGPLQNADFPSRRVYNQPDPLLPGFNPNEEHALLAPSNDGIGEALFALRNDLNAIISPKASEAYVLLKYRDPADGDWSMKPYRVFAEQTEVINGEGPFLFQYSGVAGNQIQPPYPLSRFPLVKESHGVSGPYWEDHTGMLYARAAGTTGNDTNVVIRWFYPLQPGFYYDLNVDRTNDVANGTPLAWLDRRATGALTTPNTSAGSPEIPILVTYSIRWPSTPTLQVGETLMKSKRGLPAVKNMARLEAIYDDLTPGWNPFDGDRSPITNLARLYDPLSTRTLKLGAREEIPGPIARVNRSGKEVFTGLPYVLRARLRYDPINRALEFSGILDEESYAGEPLLLPNVLSSRERDAIKDLAKGNTDWAGIVDRLYHLTRNPNAVDLDPLDGAADQALRIGLTSEYSFEYRESVASPNSSPATLVLRTAKSLVHPTRTEFAKLTGFRVVSTNVIPEPLGDLPKALTAGLAGIPSAQPIPGGALEFTGETNSLANLGSSTALANRPFTVEFWAQRKSGGGDRQVLLRTGNSSPRGHLVIGFTSLNELFFEFEQTSPPSTLVSPQFPADINQWVHWACVYDPVDNLRQIYRNGTRVAQDSPPGGAFLGIGDIFLGQDEAPLPPDPFFGNLDDLRLWTSARTSFGIRQDLAKRLTGNESTLARYFRFDEADLGVLRDAQPNGANGTYLAGVKRIPSTAPTGIPPRYLTLVENNDPVLGALPVTLHIIRVDDGPFAGDLKPILPDDVFDQRLTMRHSSDFGGDPDRAVFEWYMKPDIAGFDPEDLPIVDANGTIVDSRGWSLYTGETPTDGTGVNDVTIGRGAESGIVTISDNWFIARYRGFNVGLRGTDVWSDWIGDPSGTVRPRAALAEGWVKRVIRGLNPFDARVKDFHAAPVNTFASMLVQAGPRYEGDIAFNPSADNLNSIGLIEAYQTVLNRARRLSIDGTPAVNFNPANNALLLASSRIADLYTLLGNEAYADAQDPTIGFGTASVEYGSTASSIFAFQNQMDSLLSEELTLLRGRDDTFAGVGAPPVYNRLFWNFTLGEGEVAYQQNYNINDQNFDGFIDEKDARTLFPQGHGDAWGHYLTAIKAYYALLRHPQFTWVPRTERVNVAGVPQEVDFLDERKFARAAAARAHTGREIVDLTYRHDYVEDPAGQWQGYVDPKSDRAWGVSDWARRAGQGAYLDWLCANAILPAIDTDPTHVGIRKIDRQTVTELGDIANEAQEIQSTLDKADLGLNPVGLAKGVVPFDLDPTFNEVGSTAQIGRRAVQGLTHFDQIMERAVKGLQNALRVFNEANRATQSLRQNQDSIDDLTRNSRAQELDFKNRLIEIFGYPYAGDIGPGKTYPSGYDGPDLYRYMYVDGAEITGERNPPSATYSGFFRPSRAGATQRSFFIGDRTFSQDSVIDTQTVDTSILEVKFPISPGDYSFQATTDMGKRRAPGELQNILSDLIQANAQYKIALQNYAGLIDEIKDQLALLEALEEFNQAKAALLGTQFAGVTAANIAVGIMRGIEVNLRGTAGLMRDIVDATVEGLPKVVGLASDVTAPARGIAKGVARGSAYAMEAVADNLGLAQEVAGLGKEVLGLGIELGIEVESQKLELKQAVAGIEALFRNEAALRIEAYSQAEAIRQIVGQFQAKLAEGIRIQDELIRFRAETAADVTEARYQDMTFRVFRNDALQKYRAQFDLAARYVYLAATAYDYEINLLGDDPRAGADFLAQIVRERSLGQVDDGEPVVGQPGLADLLARLIQNFDAVRGQFGFNNPQIEGNRFSLRKELFRIEDDDPNDPNDPSDLRWREALRNGRSASGATATVVSDLWQIPEFRRHCRPFAPESLGPQPALVLRFPTTVQFGLNYFNLPLGPGDSAFDASRFATKIRSVGVWFSNYDGNGLSFTPRIYLVPTGADILRSPSQIDDFRTREWRVIDQVIPVPFPIGGASLKDPLWIPTFDTLGGSFAAIRRHAGIRAYHDSSDFDLVDNAGEISSDARLIGRSVWNTEWMMIIPGGTFLADPTNGLETFLQSNTDIKVLLQTYSYSGL